MIMAVKKNPQDPVAPRHPGWQALPTAITCVNLGLGFYAILLIMDDRFSAAAIALFAAMIADKLDGWVARKTGTYSAFGIQMDSLSDVISFGAAPALLIHQSLMVPASGPGMLAAIVYTACTAMRLARFNVMASSADLRYFTGLPCPAAAAVAAALIWTLQANPQILASWPSGGALLLVVLGAAMVSPLRYFSFKVMPSKGLLGLLLALMVAGMLSIGLQATLLASFVAYALSGPLQALLKR